MVRPYEGRGQHTASEARRGRSKRHRHRSHLQTAAVMSAGGISRRLSQLSLLSSQESDSTVLSLSRLIDSLPTRDKQRFNRLYRVTTLTSTCIVPDGLKPKVEKWFGSIGNQAAGTPVDSASSTSTSSSQREGDDRYDSSASAAHHAVASSALKMAVGRVETQQVVRISNTWTHDTALFNPLRALRPVKTRASHDSDSGTESASECSSLSREASPSPPPESSSRRSPNDEPLVSRQQPLQLVQRECIREALEGGDSTPDIPPTLRLHLRHTAIAGSEGGEGGGGSLQSSAPVSGPSLARSEHVRVSGCDFCSPELNTCQDDWGRAENSYFITASNIAKADAHHCLLIFKGCHKPMDFLRDPGYMRSFLATFSEWTERTLRYAAKRTYAPSRRGPHPSSFEHHSVTPHGAQSVEHNNQMRASNSRHSGRRRRGGPRQSSDTSALGNLEEVVPVILWNCSAKAGASQPHGHAQGFLFSPTVGKLAVTAQAERSWNHSGTDESYMEAIVRAHFSVGLGREFGDTGVFILCSLTPHKERELTIVSLPYESGIASAQSGLQAASGWDKNDDSGNDWNDRRLEDVGAALHFCIQFLNQHFGVTAFNAAVRFPQVNPFYEPLAAQGSSSGKAVFGPEPSIQQSASGPIVAHVIDRGPNTLPADFAAAEIFVAPVISSDPFMLQRELDAFAARAAVGLRQSLP